MKKPIDYAIILAEFPETEKLFAEQDEPETEPIADPDQDQSVPEEKESEEDPELDLGPFDAESLKNSMLPHLKHQDMDEFKTQEGEGYEIKAESLGNEVGAKEKLGVEDASEILETGQEYADRIAEAAGLPGRFELRKDRIEDSDDDVEYSYNLYYCWGPDDVESLKEMAASLPDAGLEEHPAETPEQAEKGPEAEQVEPSQDLLDASDFEDVKLDPSFDDIMASLADAGHMDLAESLYRIIYVQEN